MKAERNYPRYTVTPKAEAAILRGHPWVYDAEITAAEGQAENGGLVDVLSKKGRYLGTGFLSEQSKIRVRLISRNANDRFDAAFWQPQAPAGPGNTARPSCRRRTWTACRIIFGEADAFPGLTVDKFHDLLSRPGALRGHGAASRTSCCPCWRSSCGQDGQPIRGHL